MLIGVPSLAGSSFVIVGTLLYPHLQCDDVSHFFNTHCSYLGVYLSGIYKLAVNVEVPIATCFQFLVVKISLHILRKQDKV